MSTKEGRNSVKWRRQSKRANLSKRNRYELKILFKEQQAIYHVWSFKKAASSIFRQQNLVKDAQEVEND